MLDPKFVYSLEIVFMKVHSPFKIHRILTEFKTCLVNVNYIACGWTQGDKPRQKQMWWNDVFDCAIKEKRKLRKEWQNSRDKEKYRQAKKKAIYATRKVYKKPNLVVFKCNGTEKNL